MSSNTSNIEWDRLGTPAPSTLTGESKKLYDDILQFFDSPNWNFTLKLDDGRLIGPFGIELHSPGAGYAWLYMTKALGEVKELPVTPREIAILVTGAHEQAAYQVYAHSATSGLSKADNDAILNGVCPDHLDAKCKISFELATELQKPGVLPIETWNKAVEILGRKAAIAVVHYTGFYKCVATILNAFDAKAPPES